MGFGYIQIREMNLIYKGEIYGYMDFLKRFKFLKKRILVILDETLYVNKVNIREMKISNEKIVGKVIKESFGSGEDFLFNYEVTKDKENLYIYGVKGGVKVSNLCKDARVIKIIPVQIWVIDRLKVKIKEKSWKCIFKYMDVYYYCVIVDSLLEVALVKDNIKSFNNKLQELLEEETLYLDNTINKLDISGVGNINYIELGGILNEKIFGK